MTETHLPPRDIESPVPTWRTLAPRFVLPMVVMAAVVLALNHRSSGVIGVSIALAILALIVGVEVPLLLRSQRKRQEERIRSLPSGVLYACRGSTALPGHRTQFVGNLVLDQQGIVFTPHRHINTQVSIRWCEISRIQLRRARTQPLAGALILNKTDGGSHTFIVRGWGGLAKVLTLVP